MALTLSGTNGVVGAGFTLDPSGASVTVGVGTFANIVSPKFKTTGNGADVFGSGASGAYLKLINESATSNNSHQFTIDSYNASNTYWNKIKIDASEVHLNTYTGNRATLTNTALTFASGVNVVMASGNGIDFSATGDGSGTDSSELLDDYEEGSWTPTITGGAITASGAYYTKIGRVVHWYLYATITNTANNATEFRIYGLPYTVGSNSTGLNNYYGGASSFNYTQSANNAGLTSMGVLTRTGDTYIYFHFVGTGDSNAPVNSYFHSHLLNQGFIIAGAYFV